MTECLEAEHDFQIAQSASETQNLQEQGHRTIFTVLKLYCRMCGKVKAVESK